MDMDTHPSFSQGLPSPGVDSFPSDQSQAQNQPQHSPSDHHHPLHHHQTQPQSIPIPQHHQHQQYYHPLPHHQRQFGQSGIQHRRLQPNDPRRNNTLSQGIVGVVGDTSGGDYQHQQPQHQDVIMESEASASMYVPHHGNGMV